MFVTTPQGLGQSVRKQISEARLLRQLVENGLNIEVEIDGRKLDISWDPGVAVAPYLPKRHPESQAYWALPRDERAKVASITNRIFKQATGIARKLEPKQRQDKPWVRTWLRLRDVVMRWRPKALTSTTKRVWFTEPLPPSEFHRFEKAIKALELKVLSSQDPRRSRYLCWINKLKRPAVDDRIIEWNKICPQTSGAVGAAFVVGPCDITQGTPVNQSDLEQSIRSVKDVATANRSLKFITHMRSAIVVAFEMTSFPLENLRRDTDQAGLAIEKLHKWANISLPQVDSGGRTMPKAYQAIKDWILLRQRDPKSIYSCL